jgi:two-component system OmpR family sensor kinase
MHRPMKRFGRLRGWPIRWWLPALIGVVVALALVVVGVGVRSQLDGALVGIAVQALRGEAQTAIERELGPLQAPASRPVGKPSAPARAAGKPAPSSTVDDDPPALIVRRVAAALRRELEDRETVVVVYGPDGAVVERGGGVGNPRSAPAVPAERRARALQGQEVMLVQEQGGHRSLTLLLPLRTSDGAQVGVLEISRSAELIDRVEARVIGLLTVAGGVAAFVCSLLAAWAARLALRPLGLIVEATRVTGAGDLAARLDIEREDEIGELATSFDRMLDRLEASFAAQQQLVADAAHELRTPLTGLGGTIEMLQLGADRGDDATVRRLLAATSKEVDRLVQLVNDLLTLSRLDEARPIPMERLDLRPILDDTIDRLEGTARDRRLVVHLDAATVSGNRDQLERLFLNVLDNALKYTPAGGEVAVRLTAAAGRAVVAVADTGEGIPPEDLPHVFDRFYRGDPSRSRRVGGAGLGLAIANGIVRRHGGTIEAHSVLGQGTTVTVSLPLVG